MSKSQKYQSEKKHAQIVSEKIHKGPMIDLRQDQLVFTNGKKRIYDVIEHPGAVVLLAKAFNRKYLFVKQHRHAVDKILLEFPAGTIDPGEDKDICAMRELQEETGFAAKDLNYIFSTFSAPSFCTEELFFYQALNLYESRLQGEDSEEIDLVYLSLDEAYKEFTQGNIVDAKTVLGILYLRAKQ